MMDVFDDPSSCSHISMRIYHMARLFCLASLALVLWLSQATAGAAGNDDVRQLSKCN